MMKRILCYTAFIVLLINLFIIGCIASGNGQKDTNSEAVENSPTKAETSSTSNIEEDILGSPSNVEMATESPSTKTEDASASHSTDTETTPLVPSSQKEDRLASYFTKLMASLSSLAEYIETKISPWLYSTRTSEKRPSMMEAAETVSLGTLQN